MTIQASVNKMLSVASILKKAFSKNNVAPTAAATPAQATEKPEQTAATPEQATTAQTGTSGKAESSLTKKQDQVRKQRRNFVDYMRDEPVMGRKFKDLDPELQKKILSHYTTKQRKAIMDRKDAEKEVGRK